MIFFVMPCNSITGWGLCATNLCKELSLIDKIRYISDEILNDTCIKDPVEKIFFKSLICENVDFVRSQNKYPVIQGLQHDLTGYLGNFSGSKKVGICFSDRNIPKHGITNAKTFDHIIAGSKWSQNLLNNHGVDSTIIYQGIDPKLFNKSRSQKMLFKDDFVVFSGCKFEHRKGQDVFLKAYKIFQDKYPESKLIISWFNPYIKESGEKILLESEIDLNRVIILPLMLNSQFASIYQNTDVGVFPSRCEAGTNLVMTEYMACGKPVIATVGTGQGDIVNDKTGFSIKSTGACNLYENGEVVSIWEEPDPESILENLELVYNNKKEANKRAKAGAKVVSKLTWQYMAENIYKLL